MRLFLAIPLPDTVRRQASAVRSRLALPASAWRFAREDGLHITVRFLGDVAPIDHEASEDSWRAAAAGTGTIAVRVHGARVAPVTGRPRVVWLAVQDESEDGSLARLAGRVEQAARARGFPKETRPFAAHVTLARARRGARVARPDVTAVADLGGFLADRLVLFRSESEAGGSRYQELASYPFAAKGNP
jgi:2'-5' RNA ligase